MLVRLFERLNAPLILAVGLSVTCIAVGLPTVSRADSPNLVQSEGPGASTCAQFAESYRTDPIMTENMYFSWAEGMMSGMNTVMGIQKRVTVIFSVKSIEEQKAYLRNFCDAHPLVDFDVAVFSLFGTMK